jgi:hypothetical protein
MLRVHRSTHLIALVIASLVTCHGTTAATADASLGPVLDFETEASELPGGWRGRPDGTVFIDHAVVHSGRAAARIERTSGSPNQFSALTQNLPINFAGERVELRGWIRTEDVTEFAGLWLREDGVNGTLAFDNMQSRRLRGTTEWSEYAVSLPLDSAARDLYFGFLVGGTGKGWVDHLQLLVDGKPVWDAPQRARSDSVIDRDHEFDAGSRLSLVSLTPLQISNLATLCRVWGFLKYHHPAVTAGTRHWDYELFRIAPAILSATDRDQANAALVAWIDRLGPVTPGERTPLATDQIALRPELRWLDELTLLGTALSSRLHVIHQTKPGGQFYVSLAPWVGNPVFKNENAYTRIRSPDAGFQLLALFRLWNIIRYWYPYRELVPEDWDQVLAEFIPRIATAADDDAYQLELLALIAKISDTHANLWSSLNLRPPTGDAWLPATFRFVEKQLVVTDAGDATLHRGDIVLSIDGVRVTDLVRRWLPYYAASNEPTRLRDIARSIGRGNSGIAKLQIQRVDQFVDLAVARVPQSQVPKTKLLHDLPGPVFRLLSPKVAYLKLSTIKAADVPECLRQAEGTEGWIIDIRNYPAEFVVFALGNRLVDRLTKFARFTKADLENPGAFAFTPPVALEPVLPYAPPAPKLGSLPTSEPTVIVPLKSVDHWPRAAAYSGKIVILVDEDSVSQAEYTAMAFRATPRAVVVGSTTAGADGNVSEISLPGGYRTAISGIGVFYPDKRPAQQIGIAPDIVATPTIAGIRDGRDEVLEVGIRQIVNADVPAAEITEMARAGRD